MNIKNGRCIRKDCPCPTPMSWKEYYCRLTQKLPDHILSGKGIPTRYIGSKCLDPNNRAVPIYRKGESDDYTK